MKKLLTALFLIVTCVSFGWDQDVDGNYDSRAARKDGSNIVASSAFLAAIGGASLAGNNVFTGPASFTNFVQLGELATPIKMKRFIGTTPSVVASSTEPAPHGLNRTKILGYSLVCIGMNYTFNESFAVVQGGGYEIAGTIDATNFVITVGAAAAGATSKGFSLTIWYME